MDAGTNIHLSPMRTTIAGRRAVIFHLQDEQGATAFVSVSASNYYNEERVVVVANARRLIHAWRCGNGSPLRGFRRALRYRAYRLGLLDMPDSLDWLPYLEPSDWVNDRKYQHAVDGFAEGQGNPVPLSVIQASSSPSGISFINGITRTMWLIANGFTVFPVECDLRSANVVQRLIAAGGTFCITVEDLLGPQ
jgi:hypothetical protein